MGPSNSLSLESGLTESVSAFIALIWSRSVLESCPGARTPQRTLEMQGHPISGLVCMAGDLLWTAGSVGAVEALLVVGKLTAWPGARQGCLGVPSS